MKNKINYTILFVAVVIATQSCNTPLALYNQGLRMAKAYNKTNNSANSKISFDKSENKENTPIPTETIQVKDCIKVLSKAQQQIQEEQLSNDKAPIVTKKINPIKSLIKKQVNKLKKATDGDDGNKKIDGFAIAGFCTAILGLLVLSIVFGPVGIILSGVGFARNLAGKSKGLGFSIAGIAVGILDIVVWVLLFSFLLY